MSRKQPSKASKKTSLPNASISIYQNSEHVSGLLQQLADAGLITGAIYEGRQDVTDTKSAEGSGGLKAKAKAQVPLVGEVGLEANTSGKGASGRNFTTESKSVQSFVYSQAYYLKKIRVALGSLNLIKHLNTKADATALEVGDFVEYQATFTASEVTTVMDVLTPDLVGQITRFISVKKEVGIYNDFDGNYEDAQIAAIAMNERINSKQGLARDIARAAQVDFRRDKTREYYGKIGPDNDPLTAVTICDNSHFVVEDEDRILDGAFTVLGKVTSPPEEDVPVLQRNKILRNLAAEGVDAIVDLIHSKVAELPSSVVGDITVDSLIDLKLDSRIAGTSMRVIPIAIYV